MTRRAWMGLVGACAVLAALAWMLEPAGRSQGALLPPAEAAGESAPAALAPGGRGSRAEIARARPRTAPAEALAGLMPGDALAVQGAAPADQVIVRVRLVDSVGAPFSEPDHSVELVTWERETDVETVHRGPLLRQGWAEFAFDAPVHIEHARYEPVGGGLAFGYVEVHEDLELGSWYEMLLEIGTASVVSGRVEAEDGRPLAGVEVDVYGENYEDRVHGSWERGLLSTVTDASGEFRFVDLPAGWWYVCVPVVDWLQLTPNIWDEPAGRFSFDLRPGDRIDAGVFRVTRAERFTVLVVDAAGTPIPGAGIELELLEVASPAIEVLDAEEEGWERWLGGGFSSGESAVATGGDRSAWDYVPFYDATGEDGSVRLAAIAGTWRLQVQLDLACEGDASLHSEVFRVPSSDRRVVVPIVPASWSGLVRATTGEPLRWARVQLRRQTDDCRAETTALTDAQGQFRFEHLSGDGVFSVTVSANGYLPLERALGAALPAEPLTLELQKGASIQLLLVDASGLPVPDVVCVVDGGQPAPGMDRASWSALLRARQRGPVRADRRGRLTVQPLFPGSYSCRLLATNTDGPGNAELGSYVFSTDAGPQTLVLPVDGVPLAVSRSRSLGGLVVDASTGDAIPDARVRATGRGAVNTETTERDGRFEMNIDADELDLLVQASGYLPLRRFRVALDGDGTEQVLRLTPFAHSLELRFVTADGERLPSVDLALRDAEGKPVAARLSGEGWWVTETTSEASRVVLSGLAPGPLQLEVGMFGLGLGTYPIVVPDGEGRHLVTVRLTQDLDELRDEVAEAYDGEQDD